MKSLVHKVTHIFYVTSVKNNMIILSSLCAFFFGAVETCLLISILLLFSNSNLIQFLPSEWVNLENSENLLALMIISIIFLFFIRMIYNFLITRYVAYTQTKIELLILWLYIYQMRTSPGLSQSKLIKYTLTDVIDYVHMYLQPVLAISLALGSVVPFYAYFLWEHTISALLMTLFFVAAALTYRGVIHPVTIKYGKILREIKEQKVHILNDFIINYRTAFFYEFYKKYAFNFEIEAVSHAKFYHKMTFITYSIRPFLEFLSFICIALGFYYVNNIGDLSDRSNLIALLGAIMRVLPAGASLMTNISHIGYSNAPKSAVSNSIRHIESAKEKFSELSNHEFRLPNSFRVQRFECEFVTASTKSEIEKLSVYRGDKIVITGKSGSGKSTFLNALMGFGVEANLILNDIDSGIKITIKKGGFPSNVGYVPQDTALITGNLQDNICLNTAFNKSLYLSVIELCQLTSVHASERIISSTNPNLSGGEQQRLALARALYVKPDYLVLDEALSGLPISTQRQILFNISREFPEVGIIAVMHGSELLDLFDKHVNIRLK